MKGGEEKCVDIVAQAGAVANGIMHGVLDGGITRPPWVGRLGSVSGCDMSEAVPKRHYGIRLWSVHALPDQQTARMGWQIAVRDVDLKFLVFRHPDV